MYFPCSNFVQRAVAFIGALLIVALLGAAPLPPAALIAISGNNSLTLRWEASAGAASYTVQRRTTPTGTLTTVASNLTTPTYTQTGLTNGTIYYYVVTAIDGTGASALSNQARGTPYAPVVPSNVVWPLANTSAVNADVIRYAFGPRNIGRYDFHGGLDLNAPEGTPVYAVMAGTVTNKSTWDGVSSGSGNSLLVNHGAQKWAAYLHLNAFANGIGIGSVVTAGQLLGYVGKTGSTTNHLHFTYMVGLTSESVSESRSRSPLEILPHTPTTAATASFRNNGTGIVDIFLPAQQNTIRWIILKGGGLTRLVDYYDIVAQGSTDRDTQSQYGVLFNVAAPTQAYPAGGGTVQLWVAPDPASDFTPERVIVLDFNGNTLIDHVAPSSSPYDAWKLARGLSAALPDDSDDDGDGLTLLMEYALDLDPMQASQVGAPQLVKQPDRLELTYRRARSELTYEVETSTELTTWTTAGVAQAHVINGEFITASAPLDSAGKRFLRLVVRVAP